MRKTLSTLAIGCLMAASMFSPLAAHAQQKAPEPMKLKVGDMAPDFHLKYFDGAKMQDVSLSDFKGKKNVVLAFFVFAFTGG
jgi:cytochrome oxidase Cu insertion factor (SCO1/SenC/PrrC family)